MKKSVKKLAFLLSVVMIISAFCFPAIGANEDNKGSFVPGQVIVGVNESGIALLKASFSLETVRNMFVDVKITEAKDLTDVSYILEQKGIIIVDYSPSRSILLLTLEERTENAVLDAIELLKGNSYVRYAEPNLIISTATAPEDDEDYKGLFASGEVIVGVNESGIALLKANFSLDTVVNMFPEVKITEAKDLTDVSHILEEKGIDISDYSPSRSILLLKLEDNTEKAVLEAIDLLKGNSYVKYAEPNLIGGGNVEYPAIISIEIDNRIINLIAGNAANIPVKVETAFADGIKVFVGLSVNGEILVETEVKGGEAVIKAPIINTDLSTVSVMAWFEGSGPSVEKKIPVVQQPTDLWAPKADYYHTVTMMTYASVTFAAKIAILPTGKATVFGRTTASFSLSPTANQVEISVIGTVSPEPGNDKIVISGVKYPELYPSYSFTFTLTPVYQRP